MDTKLSVIVAAYNAEKYLADCLNSIMASTYRNFEILLIDDGSVDNTGAICDCFQQEHKQIRVFHTENQGLSATRNLGIKNSTGQLIGFVDADDLVVPDMFERLICAMLKCDAQLAMCGFRRCDRSNVQREFGDIQTQATECDQVNTAEQILRGATGPYVWNKIYKKDILEDHNIRFRPDVQGAEDLLFNAEYLKYCTKAVSLRSAMYIYITTEGSIMSTFRSSRVVSERYIGLPKAWRYTADILTDVSEDLEIFGQAKTAMFYQTVLRKLEMPNNSYIEEAVSYVKQHKYALRRYRWGFRYYLSALMLSLSYPLWAKCFRMGMK